MIGTRQRQHSDGDSPPKQHSNGMPQLEYVEEPTPQEEIGSHVPMLDEFST